jgi:hypothetical protein
VEEARIEVKPVNCGRIRGDEDALLRYLNCPYREQESFLELGAMERRHWISKFAGIDDEKKKWVVLKKKMR